MARIRSIKPEFWTDEKVVGLSPFARLLFIGLWNFVDDEGRAVYSPARLKMQILPADSVDVSELLGEIRRASLIDVYVIDGKEYLLVTGFTKHQKVDKRSPSKLPAPEKSAELPRNVPPDQGRDQGRDQGKAAPRGAPDLMTLVFSKGVEYLQSATGRSEGACRSFLGKCRKSTTDEALIKLLGDAQRHGVIDPCAWIEGALKQKAPAKPVLQV